MSNLSFEYDHEDDSWVMLFNGEDVFSVSSYSVFVKYLEEGYDCEYDAFVALCKDEIFNMVNYVDLTFSIKWLLSYLLKYDMYDGKGGE